MLIESWEIGLWISNVKKKIELSSVQSIRSYIDMPLRTCTLFSFCDLCIDSRSIVSSRQDDGVSNRTPWVILSWILNFWPT